MPILQSRLLRIIQAAQVFIQRDRRLCEIVEAANAKVAVGRISAESALYDITIHIKSREHPTYHPAEQIIAEEIWHYNHSIRRNSTERERIRRTRAAARAAESSTLNNTRFIVRGDPNPADLKLNPHIPPSEIHADPADLDIDSLSTDDDNLAIAKAADAEAASQESPELIAWAEHELATMTPDQRRNFDEAMRDKEYNKK